MEFVSLALMLSDRNQCSRNRPNDMSRSQDLITNLLASADIRINGRRPWDIQVYDQRFVSRVLASGTLGFGESYGWLVGLRGVGRDVLPRHSCRAEKRFAFRLPNV